MAFIPYGSVFDVTLNRYFIAHEQERVLNHPQIASGNK